MTDHCYWMSALNQNIGYSQPTNLGYYLGSDLTSDALAWEEAAKVQNKEIVTDIVTVVPEKQVRNDNSYYNMMGQKVSNPHGGIFIHKGKKIMIE